MKSCQTCGCEIPSERADLGLKDCIKCSDVQPIFGFMVFDSEGCAPQLCLTESKSFVKQANQVYDLTQDLRRAEIKALAEELGESPEVVEAVKIEPEEVDEDGVLAESEEQDEEAGD